MLKGDERYRMNSEESSVIKLVMRNLDSELKALHYRLNKVEAELDALKKTLNLGNEVKTYY